MGWVVVMNRLPKGSGAIVDEDPLRKRLGDVQLHTDASSKGAGEAFGVSIDLQSGANAARDGEQHLLMVKVHR